MVAITECWLGSFVVLQGIQTSIGKSHSDYIFVIFQGGWGSELPISPLDLHLTTVKWKWTYVSWVNRADSNLVLHYATSDQYIHWLLL